MPTIVDYPAVLAQLQAQGLKCLYFNSGAFGFPAGVETISRGWIGPEDGSIREAVRSMVRPVGPPFAKRLAALLKRARQQCLAGPVWLMPKSHWAFELEYGSNAWMPALLRDIGLDPAQLAGLNTAAAIEFLTDEDDVLEAVAHRLLDGLIGSDFMLIFTDCRTICTIHSHMQLWWTTADAAVAAGLDRTDVDC